MYIRTARGSFSPGTDAQQLTALTQTVVDPLKAQPGFVSLHIGLNQQSGTLLVITLWKDEESASFPREAFGGFISQAQALGLQLTPTELYEVTVTA